MIDGEDRALLSRLVGCWRGTLLHRCGAGQSFEQLPGTSENRWVMGGRFVEMTLRADDNWSAILYIGHESGERRHVLVSLEPGDRRLTTRRGMWSHENFQLILMSDRTRAVCDITTPGELRLELAEECATGETFVRFRAEYRAAVPAIVVTPRARMHRRFVIA